MEKTNNVLRLVEGSTAKKESVRTPAKKSVRKHAKPTYNTVKVAKNIRHEATELRTAANVLFAVGMIIELVFCVHYNIVTEYLGVWGGIAIVLTGLFLCLSCILFAMFINGTCAVLERNAERLNKGAK